jgi:hypothetical protein
LKKVIQDLVNCKKPTGDPDRPPNVTRAKEIERDIEAEVGMTTVNDARRDSDSGSDEESQDDEEASQASLRHPQNLRKRPGEPRWSAFVPLGKKAKPRTRSATR